MSIIGKFINSLKINEQFFSTGDYKYSSKSSDHGKWLICQGQQISRTTYADLFNLIGTSFGAGNGSTTFNLPDFRGRVCGAIGQGAGLTSRSLGNSVGAETHTLIRAELPSWTPASGDFGLVRRTIVGENKVSSATTSTINSGLRMDQTIAPSGALGSDQAHNNMQPTLFAGNVFIFY